MSDVLYHAEHYFGWMRANPTWQRESETIDTLIAEIDRLRHELADAHGVAQACEIRAERAEAEIERLRDFIKRDWPYSAGPLEVVAERDAEIARLRELLREGCDPHCAPGWVERVREQMGERDAT